MKSMLFGLVFVFISLSLSSSEEIRSFDGSGNNLAFPNYGKAGSPLVREDPSKISYIDGFSTPDPSLPSARFISNRVFYNNESVLSGKGLTDFATYWGQFLDHDITASTISVNYAAREYLNITVPQGDPYMDPSGLGNVYMSFGRAVYEEGSGVSGTPRKIINHQSSWIDGSAIYGVDKATCDILRTFTGGKMKTQVINGEILPPQGLLNNMENSARRVDTSFLFSCGDIRCNENPGLLSLHTLFLREHNRLADKFAAQNASLSDEELFQKSRKWIIAFVQEITMNEYMAAILGVVPDPSETYDATVSPDIMVEFASGAFRYGHSEVNDFFLRLDNNYQSIAAGNIGLKDAYYNPEAVSQGVDSILRGMTRNIQLEVDPKYPDALRNFLFGPNPYRGGHDLVALNIQRARDHGVPSYNDIREMFGLARKNSFAEVTSDTTVAQDLSAAYGGDIDACEIYSCGICEDHFVHESGSTANVGETFFTVINEQYRRMRVGDRLYYSFSDNGLFNASEIATIRATKLADIIVRNTQVKTGVQCSVMTRFVTECPTGGTPNETTDDNPIPKDGSLTNLRFGVLSTPTKKNPKYGQATYSYFVEVDGNQVETPILYVASGTNYTFHVISDSTHQWVFSTSLTSQTFHEVNSSSISRRVSGTATFWWVPSLESDGDTLFYACSLHAYMGNQINIVAPLPESSTSANTATTTVIPSGSYPSGSQTVAVLRVSGNVTKDQVQTAISGVLNVNKDRVVVLNITRVTTKRQDTNKRDVTFALTDSAGDSISSRVLLNRLIYIVQSNPSTLSNAGLTPDGNSLTVLSVNYGVTDEDTSASTSQSNSPVGGANGLTVSFGLLFLVSFVLSNF